MTVLLILSLFAGFVGLDFLLREVTRRTQARRDRARREAILNTPVRLDFAFEARTLQRVEIPDPRARILVVDDEPVVLDSFRRILVLEGYSIDTVEHGPEALYLVRRNDYDLVFTDLKMPDMDGVEVVKAVKHLRPDMDVVVCTGYGSIETAVATMKHGGADYIRKPFTPEELVGFVDRLLVRREARLLEQRPPMVRLIAPGEDGDDLVPGEYRIPGGAFISTGHSWVRIEPGGEVRIGIDDFVRKEAGKVSQITLPREGQTVHAGDPLFSLRRGAQELRFRAPVSGKVVEDNPDLKADARPITASPYVAGWVCRIEPADLGAELPSMHIGKSAMTWYDDEIKRLRQLQDGKEALDWTDLEKGFLTQV
jgi:CheY-like chemotaxis protein